MSYISRNRPVHAERFERFLGREAIARVQQAMTQGGGMDAPPESTGPQWHGPPIYLADVPGNVYASRDGDFHGHLPYGFGAFACLYDVVEARAKRIWREIGRQAYRPVMPAGFASISDALARASAGNRQFLNGGQILKSGVTGVVSRSSTLWRLGSMPAAGTVGAAAPGGTVNTSSTTGALVYINPASGTLHLTGADMSASVVNNTLLLYDRLFSVAKTASSTATEAVTGVPTRYTSTTTTNQDYIGGNFGFVEVGSGNLGATAHNWTTCLYNDQANASSTLPSVTAQSGATATLADNLDIALGSWFMPLEAGDVGIKAWTQMQNSASVTGATYFCIGHPLGFMMFPIINTLFPFDWLTNKDQAPRIFDNACLALLELTKPATTPTTYTGLISATSAAP